DRAFLLSVFSGARYRLANDPRGAGLPGKKTLYTHLSQVDKHQHMVLQNIEVVRKFGITTDNLTVDFFIPDEARKWAAELFHGCGIQTDDVVVHVHPTARWLFKCWDDASMARLIDWLLLQGFWVIMTSSSSEKEMKKSKKISSLVGEPRRFLDLSGQTTIKQLAAISAQSTLFVGVDTAPMHIAAAVGIPVVALFGPTGELEWGPWGSQHIILTKKMRCANCHAEICEGLELRECMEAITVDEVVAAVKEILWSRGKPVLTEGVSDNG
ncbi:MAG TPA: glycosyltransferase family 9 protein, partial [Dissulfurispiraceae bacterium]|nr:glycosyltransferase family 9 protein [Dissulfurispiraceae bacterium]